jgi:hypothetical protein
MGLPAHGNEIERSNLVLDPLGQIIDNYCAFLGQSAALGSVTFYRICQNSVLELRNP